MTASRDVHFTPGEMKRLRVACRALNTSFAEFLHFATMQALDECEAIGRDAEAVRRYYERENR